MRSSDEHVALTNIWNCCCLQTSGQQELDLLVDQIADKEAEAQSLQAELQSHRSREETCSSAAAEANSRLQVSCVLVEHAVDVANCRAYTPYCVYTGINCVRTSALVLLAKRISGYDGGHGSNELQRR